MGNTSYSAPTPQEVKKSTIAKLRDCLKEAETLLNKLEDEG